MSDDGESMNERLTYENMAGRVGSVIGVSEWLTVSQEMIDQFAACTHDDQWIHIDVARAERESPFGGPIAHGFLTLSLIAGLSTKTQLAPHGTVAAFNYGLDKVRFLAPVLAGKRVRLRTTLTAFDEKEPGQFLMKASNVIEIEGQEKPALIAETLALFVREKEK